MDSEDEEYACTKTLKNKGKTQTFLPQYSALELKHRTRRGKCFGAAGELSESRGKKHMETTQEAAGHIYISSDIWFHLANYIAPEDVKNYSLICRQSAYSVKSRCIWLQMYKRYCQQSTTRSSKWVLDLPDDLQMKNLKACDLNTLRQKVIQALYICYPPFKLRLQTAYTLDTLVGRFYVSSWYKVVQCLWIMCYKFQLNANKKPQKSSVNTVDKKRDFDDALVENWECLADETNIKLCIEKQSNSTPSYSKLDGVFILVVCSEHYVPFPMDIACSHDIGPLRFAAGRALLSKDMISKNLELDFVSITNQQTITVKYHKVPKFKVIPWWHPDFKTFIKCD